MGELEIIGIPCSAEAEQSVIGSLLIDPAAWWKCSGLQTEMFHLPQHRAIWTTLAAMLAAGKAVDVITVHEALKTAATDDLAGGLDYLIDLAQNTPSSANLSHYAAIVKNRFIERELLLAAEKIKHAATDKDGKSTADKIADSIAAVGAVSKLAVRNKGESYTEQLAQTIEWLEKRAEMGNALEGLSTGLYELDEKTGGLKNGNLIVIAARPGMGKTVLAENIARAALKAGKAVHFQSYEMTANELNLRSMAAECGIELQTLKTAKFTQSEYDKISAFVGMAAMWKMSVSSESLNVDELIALAMEKANTAGLDLLVVDHLHIMPRKGQNEVTELGEISRRLKQLAMDLKIPVVLLAQLNRNVTNQTDKRPSLAQIRASGRIEEDANVVIMPHRESYYNEDANPYNAELCVVKNRDGETGSVIAGWDGTHQRFTNQINTSWQPPKKSGWNPNGAL